MSEKKFFLWRVDDITYKRRVFIGPMELVKTINGKNIITKNLSYDAAEAMRKLMNAGEE